MGRGAATATPDSGLRRPKAIYRRLFGLSERRSGQYIYSIERKAYAEHLQRVGQLLHKLVTELQAKYTAEPAYQVLDRVFKEHFVSHRNAVRAKKGRELSADSLQSPDDWEATYRQKRGQEHIGYVTNVTETCDPKNPFQLTAIVQTESNNVADSAMLAETLPSLKERTGVNEMRTKSGISVLWILPDTVG